MEMDRKKKREVLCFIFAVMLWFNDGEERVRGGRRERGEWERKKIMWFL